VLEGDSNVEFMVLLVLTPINSEAHVYLVASRIIGNSLLVGGLARSFALTYRLRLRIRGRSLLDEFLFLLLLRDLRSHLSLPLAVPVEPPAHALLNHRSHVQHLRRVVQFHRTHALPESRVRRLVEVFLFEHGLTYLAQLVTERDFVFLHVLV